MSHTSDYIERQKAECRARWFKDHKATCAATGDIHGMKWDTCLLIKWQHPQSWNYGCRFIIHRRWLCVVGDIGEAVFEWSEDITLDFLSKIDFGYFMSKCQASPDGRKFEQWDTRVLELYRTERLAELQKRASTDDEAEEDKAELELLENNSRCSKDEWDSSVRDYYDAIGDAEGASSLTDMGVVPSVHAIGMFVGLQLAIQQLKERPQP